MFTEKTQVLVKTLIITKFKYFDSKKMGYNLVEFR